MRECLQPTPDCTPAPECSGGWPQSQELAAAEREAREETTQAVISMKDSYQSLHDDLEENMKMFTQCAPQPWDSGLRG